MTRDSKDGNLRTLSRRAMLGGSIAGLGLLAAACGEPTVRYVGKPQAGPAGPAGPQGPKGEAGAKGAPGTRGAAGKEPVVLSTFVKVPGEMVERYKPVLIDPYTKDHPHVTIEFIPNAGGTQARFEKMLTLVVAGTAPHIWEGPRAAEWLHERDIIEPLADLAKRDKIDFSVYNRKHLERAAFVKGEPWVMPHGYGGNFLCIACNVDMFARAGVKIPPADWKKSWSWNEWVEALRKLRQQDSSGKTTVFGMNSYAHINGSWNILYKNADWISDDLKTVTCDSPQMELAMTRIFDVILKHKAIPKPGELKALFGDGSSSNAFRNGKAAMDRVSPPGIRRTFDAKFVEFSLAPTPRGDIATPDMNMHVLALVKGAGHREEAWQYLKWLTIDGKYQRFVRRVPVIKSQVEPWVRAGLKDYKNPRPEVILGAVEHGRAQYNLGRHQKGGQSLKMLNKVWNEEVFTEKISVKTALQKLKPQLQAFLFG